MRGNKVVEELLVRLLLYSQGKSISSQSVIALVALAVGLFLTIFLCSPWYGRLESRASCSLRNNSEQASEKELPDGLSAADSGTVGYRHNAPTVVGVRSDWHGIHIP